VPDREAELSRQLQEARERIEERLGRIEQAVGALDGKVGRVSAEIGFGLPDVAERGDRPTLRDRMHLLESDDQTLRVLAGGLTDQLTQTAAVVSDLKEERDHMRIERAASERRWTRLRVVIVTVGAAIGGLAAVIGAIGVILRLYGIGG
jgi:uncharacterized protein YPO0396